MDSAATASANQPPNANAPTETAPSEDELRPHDASLPQTEERPQQDDRLTQARAKALFAAIVSGEPSAGEVFFFPLEAYKQVKDSRNPEADWKNRLIAHYTRDVRELRKSLGALDGASFVGLRYDDKAARWVKPGEEYNKLGYFRVFRAELVYTRADGRERSIPLKSLISWRGKFYLVHLSSFQ